MEVRDTRGKSDNRICSAGMAVIQRPNSVQLLFPTEIYHPGTDHRRYSDGLLNGLRFLFEWESECHVVVFFFSCHEY